MLDNVPPSGDHQYARGYYGSDVSMMLHFIFLSVINPSCDISFYVILQYGRGQHPSFYRGGHPNGRGYGRGYY